jgi:hypothetical protein
VAKKKKGARKAASRSTRKAPRKTVRAVASAPHIAATRGGKVTWRMEPGQIVLTPLKAILGAHIDRLSKISDPNDQIRATISTLERTKAELGSICGTTMVIPG